MKKIILPVAVVFLLSFYTANTVYDYSIVLNDGNEVQLSAYSGKNIMITILPAVPNDSNKAILHNIDSMHNLYADSIVMIGIPSYEDGFEDDSLESVMNWYHSVFDTSFILAQAMNTRKASPYQSPLFKWLTHANENGHFNDDALGAGENFFINEEGMLTGLSVPGVMLTKEIIDEIIQIAD